MIAESRQVLEKLDAIKSELDYIREHMADVDMILTDDDVLALKDAEDDLKAGKTKRL